MYSVDPGNLMQMPSPQRCPRPPGHNSVARNRIRRNAPTVLEATSSHSTDHNEEQALGAIRKPVWSTYLIGMVAEDSPAIGLLAPEQ